MSKEPEVIDPRCCTSGCKRCPYHTRDVQPASKWCEHCEATVYVDDSNRCQSCEVSTR